MDKNILNDKKYSDKHIKLLKEMYINEEYDSCIETFDGDYGNDAICYLCEYDIYVMIFGRYSGISIDIVLRKGINLLS